MTRPTVEVTGANELRKALRGVAGGIKDLKVTHAEAAKVVEVRAGQIVPRRTGRLATSIRSSGQAAGGIVRAGKATVPYAGVIHFGSPKRGIKAQPFLYDALDDRRNQVVETYEKRVRTLINKNGLD